MLKSFIVSVIIIIVFFLVLYGWMNTFYISFTGMVSEHVNIKIMPFQLYLTRAYVIIVLIIMAFLATKDYDLPLLNKSAIPSNIKVGLWILFTLFFITSYSTIRIVWSTYNKDTNELVVNKDNHSHIILSQINTLLALMIFITIQLILFHLQKVIKFYNLMLELA